MINQYHKRDDTICWKCANAYGDGCRWFSDDEPIPGWEAVNYKYKATGCTLVMDCYAVHRCPEFKPNWQNESHRIAKNLDTQGCIDLISAVFMAMHQDYLEDPRQRPGIVRFMRSRIFGDLGCGVDSEVALEKLQKEAVAYDLKRKKADHAFGTKLRSVRDDYILNKKHRAKIRELMFKESFIKEYGLEPQVAVVVLKSYTRVYDERQRKKRQNARAKERARAKAAMERGEKE